MLKFKKTTLAIFVAATSSVSLAGTMGPVCTPGSVTVPCVQSAWDFGAKALYLQTNMGAANFPDFVTNSSGEVRYNNQGNPWDWGFMIEGSYHFGSGNDANLNWYHMNNNHRVIQSGVISFAFTTVEETGTVAINTKPSWDAVNLEFAQRVDYSQQTSVRFHGGAEYVRIHMQRIYDGVFTVTDATLANVFTRTLVYNGFGPRVGADAWYNFNNGLAVYAKSAIGLYAGTSSFKFVSNPAIAFVPNHSGSSMDIVPELEAKLGASYTYAMSLGDVSLDAGWMWVNYFSPLTDASNGIIHADNFGVQGPYIGLKWVGNLA